jgi:hypothetical protein
MILTVDPQKSIRSRLAKLINNVQMNPFQEGDQ